MVFSANSTNNEIYDGSKLNQTGFEIYYFADPEKVNLSGNYIEEPTACCIYSGSGVDASEKIISVDLQGTEHFYKMLKMPLFGQCKRIHYDFRMRLAC